MKRIIMGKITLLFLLLGALSVQDSYGFGWGKKVEKTAAEKAADEKYNRELAELTAENKVYDSQIKYMNKQLAAYAKQIEKPSEFKTLLADLVKVDAKTAPNMKRRMDTSLLAIKEAINKPFTAESEPFLDVAYKHRTTIVEDLKKRKLVTVPKTIANFIGFFTELASARKKFISKVVQGMEKAVNAAIDSAEKVSLAESEEVGAITSEDTES